MLRCEAPIVVADASEPASSRRRLRLHVDGMTCAGCEHHVEQALRAAGATEVAADFRRQEATFTVQGGPDTAALRRSVEQAGHRAGAPKPVTPLAGQAAELRLYRLPVVGMTCSDCERHVAEALLAGGASKAEANFHRGEARFSAPMTADPERIARAIAATTRYTPGIPEPLVPERTPARRNSHGGGAARFDLAVVGSGGGAFAGAITAVERGARAVMIERGTLGGTCVNVGCVPSKTQLRAGELFWHAGHHPFGGIRTKAEAVDLAGLVHEKDELVGMLRQEKYADLIDEYGWELVRGEAAFEGPQTLRVNGRAIRADAYVLATGARPALPPIAGLAEVDYLTSTSLLDLQTLPEHLVVIGAGYVGLELGQLFRHFGSRVTLLQRGERLLRAYDPELGEAVHDILTSEGIEVLLGVSHLRAEQDGHRKRVVIRVAGEERTIEGDALLVATGRTPNTEALNLAGGHVGTGPRGEIAVDQQLRTSNPRVFAAGDVTLGPQYVYVAAHEGAVAAENALGGARPVDLRAVPGVTFTAPAIATVGFTEEAARQAGYEPKAAVLPLHAVPRALANRDERGLFKIVADAHTDEVLGLHIVAEHAGEAIYAGVLAVRFHLTVRDLTDTFAPYLTMSEGLKLAAQSFGRDVSKLSCCAA
jgi:mercuric reductase